MYVHLYRVENLFGYLFSDAKRAAFVANGKPVRSVAYESAHMPMCDDFFDRAEYALAMSQGRPVRAY